MQPLTQLANLLVSRPISPHFLASEKSETKTRYNICSLESKPLVNHRPTILPMESMVYDSYNTICAAACTTYTNRYHLQLQLQVVSGSAGKKKSNWTPRVYQTKVRPYRYIK